MYLIPIRIKSFLMVEKGQSLDFPNYIVVLSPGLLYNLANSGDNDEILKLLWHTLWSIYTLLVISIITPSDGVSFKEGLILTKFV